MLCEGDCKSRQKSENKDLKRCNIFPNYLASIFWFMIYSYKEIAKTWCEPRWDLEMTTPIYRPHFFSLKSPEIKVKSKIGKILFSHIFFHFSSSFFPYSPWAISLLHISQRNMIKILIESEESAYFLKYISSENVAYSQYYHHLDNRVDLAWRQPPF